MGKKTIKAIDFDKFLDTREEEANELEAAKKALKNKVDSIEAGPVLRKTISLYESFQSILDFADLLESIKSSLDNQHSKKIVDLSDIVDEFIGATGKDIYKKNTFDERIPGDDLSLVSLYDWVNDGITNGRLTLTEFNSIPLFKKLKDGVEKPSYTTVSLGEEAVSVPTSGMFLLTDNKTGMKFFLHYFVKMGLAMRIESHDDFLEATEALVDELKDSYLNSPYFKGKILEIGAGINICNKPDSKRPILESSLEEELKKNIINTFDKLDQFKSFGLPAKRAVILEGPPGTGKTLIAKWVAQQLYGRVTTLWVTAKSIDHPSDVARVFMIAKKMSPCLIVMEDLDLVSGSRQDVYKSNVLGEMLNQMDGLSNNDNIAIIASTNKVKSLDEALSDRPGRFDRVFEVGLPSPEVAMSIAKEYLLSKNVSQEVVDSLSLNSIKGGDLSGAQIVEICKGGLYEAIFRGSPLNDLCINKSASGLKDQRKRLNKV